MLEELCFFRSHMGKLKRKIVKIVDADKTVFDDFTPFGV